MLLNSCSIPHSLLKALIFEKEFSPVESKLLLFICEKTIGWQKDTQWLTQEYIAQNIGWKNSSTIYQYLASLKKKKAIKVEEREEYGKKKRFYCLNEERWGLSFSIPVDYRYAHLESTGAIKDIISTKETIEDKRLSDSETSSDSFSQLWKAYPKKELKKKSEEIWRSKKLDRFLVEILNFIERAKLTDRWKKGYVKQLPVFLNGECWNDDLSMYNESSAEINNNPIEF